MDTFQFNKYAMAILGTLFLVFSLNFLSESIFYVSTPEEPSFVIAEVDTEGETEDAAAEDTGPAFDPVTPLLASADAAEGEKSFRKCAACHTVENGGANKVGPNLWDIVNREVAAHPGFSYSSALEEYGADKDWGYESLNGFLWKPKTYIPGTSMGFAGIGSAEERADVIAYLRSLSDSPAPLPDPEAEAASAEGETSEAADDESADNEATDSGTTDAEDAEAGTSGAGDADTGDADAGDADAGDADAGESDTGDADAEATGDAETGTAEPEAADAEATDTEATDGEATDTEAEEGAGDDAEADTTTEEDSSGSDETGTQQTE